MISKNEIKNNFWVLFAVGMLACPVQLSFAAETFDPAQNPSTPTVSADKNLPSSPPEIKSGAELGPLSKPEMNQPGDTAPDKNPSLRDMINMLNLSNEEKAVLTKKIGEVIQSLDKLHDQTTQANPKTHSSEALQNSIAELLDFATQNEDHPDVQKTIAVALTYIFDHLEKKSNEIKTESLETKSGLQLFNELLTEADKQNSPEATLQTALSSAPCTNKPSDQIEQVKQKDQAMDAMIEILRKGAVNDKTTAMQRSLYRNLYLTMTQKTRMLRLSRLRNMLAEQKRAEEFKVSAVYQ